MSESWDRSHDHVVDGNNMLHALGLVRSNMKPEAFQAARSRFVADLKRLWTGPGHLLVCLDGHESPAIAMAHRGQVVSRHLETRFSLQQSADDLIIQLVNETARPERLTVVSGDNDITREAKRRGCPVAACVDWFSWLQNPAGAPRSAPTPTIPDEKPAAINGLEGLAGAFKRDIELQQVESKVPSIVPAGPSRGVSASRKELADPLKAMLDGAQSLLEQTAKPTPLPPRQEIPPPLPLKPQGPTDPDSLDVMMKGARALLSESSRAATAPRPDTPRPLRGAVDPGHAVGDIAGMGLPEDFINECRQIIDNEQPKPVRYRPRGL